MASRSRSTSGTFFLRNSLITNGVTMTTDSIDISSFINVLNGELLRIKQVWWNWGTDGSGPVLGADLGASKGCSAVGSISTESRTTPGSIGGDSDIVALNTLYAHTDANADIDFIMNETTANPKDFDDGYLVATDAIHINALESGDTFANPVAVKVMMECETVKLSLSDAQAVLVSQTIG